VPDRSSDIELQILEIDVAPAKCKQFTDPKSGCRVEKSQRALSDEQLAEEELKFEEFENLRRLLPLRTLTDEFDWIAVKPPETNEQMTMPVHYASK
jgi:hypothetical protein